MMAIKPLKFYKLYHLVIASDLDLPELTSVRMTHETRVDVTIKQAHVDTEGMPHSKIITPYLQVSHSELWFKVEGVAFYQIVGGKEIRYQPVHRTNEDSIRLFLLGSCMGALLIQRGLLVLHGCTFRVGNGCIICLGKSGAGKSTLAGGLMQRGYQIIADDVCAISHESEVLPGMPRIKLWADSAEKLGIDTSSLRRIRPGLDKFDIPLANNVCKVSLPLKAIFVLNPAQETMISREVITGMDGIEALISNTYRLGYYQGMEKVKTHLEQCSRIAKNISIYRVHRPQNMFKIDELISTIMETSQQIINRHVVA